jgi:hypothetical protein
VNIILSIQIFKIQGGSMSDKYRGKKSKGLHDTLKLWEHYENHGTSYLGSDNYENLGGDFIYFDTNLIGLKKLSEEGHRIEEKEITWHNISRIKETIDTTGRRNQPYFEFRVYIGDIKNNSSYLASFALEFFGIKLPERNLKKIFHGKNEYVEFFTDKKEDINNLIKKGYRIQRAKVAWKPISLNGKSEKN